MFDYDSSLGPSCLISRMFHLQALSLPSFPSPVSLFCIFVLLVRVHFPHVEYLSFSAVDKLLKILSFRYVYLVADFGCFSVGMPLWARNHTVTPRNGQEL